MYTEYANIFYQQLQSLVVPKKQEAPQEEDKFSYENPIIISASSINAPHMPEMHKESVPMPPYNKPESKLPEFHNYEKYNGQTIEQKQTQEKRSACFNCYGTKVNRKGNVCKKCNGTGLISKEDYSILKNIVAEEVKACIQSMREEIMQLHQMQPKPNTNVKMPTSIQPSHAIPPIIKPHQKQSILACYYCGTPFKDEYYTCSSCPGINVCEICNCQGFHNHPLAKHSANNEQNDAKPKQSFPLSQLKICMTDIPKHVLAPGEKKFQELKLYNSLDDWPSNSVIYAVQGDRIFAGETNVIAEVGQVPKGGSKTVVLQIVAPNIMGEYKTIVQLGYPVGHQTSLIGERIEVGISVKNKATSIDENVNALVSMGFDNNRAREVLQGNNNDLDTAVAILTH